jgi:2-polyprenyl-3-methyl-5-hydroxy-6-metoxy-1,4-benzoquinol methylase
MFVSQHRHSSYRGLPEMAAAGLHTQAFELFRRHVAPGARVLDLGSGAGAWAQRLHDACYLVTASDLEPRHGFEFPYRPVDLNQNFGEKFSGETFDAVSMVEVIEHLENPRHVFRQIRALVKPGGIVLVSTPNASGLYSRVRFFFTGQMAMFTDNDYAIGAGHITPLTAWQLEKVFAEYHFKVLDRQFHDASFFPPRSSGDLAKIVAWSVLRPPMRGVVGGQSILYALETAAF